MVCNGTEVATMGTDHTNSDSLYSKDHEPDPVTHDAVAAAMAATDSTRLPWWKRAGTVLLSIFFVIAVGASGVTAYNTIQENHQGKVLSASNKILTAQTQQLRDQQTCLENVITTFETDNAARGTIADDDRTNIADLVKNIETAKSKDDIETAFANFNARATANAAKRNQYPLTVSVSCNLGTPSPPAK